LKKVVVVSGYTLKGQSGRAGSGSDPAVLMVPAAELFAITAEDFDGWVQESVLFFWGEWGVAFFIEFT
jgi:hypothetical protein